MASKAAGESAKKLVHRFSFPDRSVKVIPVWGSMPQAKRVAAGSAVVKPYLQHMGVVETQGHRGPHGRWIRARGIIGPRPNGKSHQRGVEQLRGWTHPYDRIEKWYIGPGDKVRLLVGKDKDKYNDASVGVDSGYKLYTVTKLDQKKNRVYLDEFKSKHSQPEILKPEGWNDWSKQEQEKWRENPKNNVRPTNKPVQVTNVGLCIKEDKADPTGHIFATRMKTGKAVWIEEEGRWYWPRYVVQVSRLRSEGGYDSIQDEMRKRLPALEDLGMEALKLTDNGYDFAWPQSAVDTSSTSTGGRELTKPDIVTNISYSPIEPSEWAETLRDLIPKTTRSPPPSDQFISDVYLESKHVQSEVDSAMPLYLGEELSPRFTRHDRAERYRVMEENLKKAKADYVAAQVEVWEALGRDRYLRETMDLPEANLRGVPIKPRTKAEIVEAAEIEWDQERERKAAEAKKQMRQGYRFNLEEAQWEAGPVALHRQAKRERKVEKAEDLSKRLEQLKLSPRKNMYVPLEARKDYVSPRAPASAPRITAGTSAPAVDGPSAAAEEVRLLE